MSTRQKEELQFLKSTEIIQHTEPDVRFYEEDGIYYPSVTTKLDLLPKDPFLEQWRDKEGAKTVDIVLYEAATSGTKVHDAIDFLCVELLGGNSSPELQFFDDFGKRNYKPHEWEGILRFVDFYNNHVKTIILSEARLCSKRLFCAGTTDLVAELMDGRIALIDHKFANNVSDRWSVQTWVYKELVEEVHGIDIDVRGNLWLKAHTRGEDKKGKKIQGKGWQFIEHLEHERDERIYNCSHDLFMDMWRNKEIVPTHKTFPLTAKLNVK